MLSTVYRLITIIKPSSQFELIVYFISLTSAPLITLDIKYEPTNCIVLMHLNAMRLCFGWM